MSRSEAAEEPDFWGVGNQGPFLRTSSRMWKLSPSQRPGPATTYHRAGKSRRWRAALLSGSRAHATPKKAARVAFLRSMVCTLAHVIKLASCRGLARGLGGYFLQRPRRRILGSVACQPARIMQPILRGLKSRAVRCDVGDPAVEPSSRLDRRSYGASMSNNSCHNA